MHMRACVCACDVLVAGELADTDTNWSTCPEGHGLSPHIGCPRLRGHRHVDIAR